jgi:hypothetical protein
MNKRFSRKLYVENDAKGKAKGIEFLSQLGYTELATSEMYKKGDIKMRKEGKLYIAEVEIKSQWKKEDSWQLEWKDIRIPYRKKESDAAFYIMFNHNCTCLAFIDMFKVKESDITQVSNRFMDNEDFFSIPYEKWTFYKKTTVWEEIDK